MVGEEGMKSACDAMRAGALRNSPAKPRFLTIQFVLPARRTREAVTENTNADFGSGGDTVEVDVTFIGREPGKPVRCGIGHKMKVLTLVGRRTGRALSIVVDDLKIKTFLPILKANIAAEATVHTDEAMQYDNLREHFTKHASVNHSPDENVRGDVITNTVEGYFSIFKRGMKGMYQHCSKQHLHRYAAEFAFRYSNAAKPSMILSNSAILISRLLSKVYNRPRFRLKSHNTLKSRAIGNAHLTRKIRLLEFTKDERHSKQRGFRKSNP